MEKPEETLGMLTSETIRIMPVAVSLPIMLGMTFTFTCNVC